VAGRTQGVGTLQRRRGDQPLAVRPELRASGVPLRRPQGQPYLGYETYDFDVVVGEHGDVFDRYLVRLGGVYQSTRILDQALDRLPDGPINATTRACPAVQDQAMKRHGTVIFISSR